MGNYIYFLTACLNDNLVNPFCQLFSTVSHGRCTVMIAITNHCTISLKLCRYSSPVIKMFKIPEKYAMHHKNRIFRTAYPLFFALQISLSTHFLHADFLTNCLYNNMKHDKMCNRYPSTHDSKHSPSDSKLLRCRIHHNNSYPENNAFHKNSYPCPDKPVNWRFYYSCRTAKPFFITACNT